MTDNMNDKFLVEIKELRTDMNSGFDKVTDKLHDNNITLAIQAEQLKEHIRRTSLLEEGQKSLYLDLEPLQEQYSFIKNGLKWAGIISSLLAFSLIVKQLFF